MLKTHQIAAVCGLKGPKIILQMNTGEQILLLIIPVYAGQNVLILKKVTLLDIHSIANLFDPHFPQFQFKWI